MISIKYYIIITSLIFLYSCSGAPRFTSINDAYSENRNIITNNDTIGVENINEELTEDLSNRYNNFEILEVVEGLASYYGEKFHGKPTASGEIFDMYELTAAHKAYPLGSYAKVTNLRNNKTVIVKINDRGPVPKDRIIDLSYGAAKIIGMLDEGLGKVRVEIIEWGKK